MYRCFVGEALKALTQNTATYVGYEDFIEHGLILQRNYAEMINPEREPEPEETEDTRSCDEIAAEIFQNMKRKGVK